MQLFIKIKEIWEDPVWSKVISAGIIAVLGFLIMYIFKSYIKFLVPYFKQYYREMIIILLFLVLVIILVSLLLQKLKKKKANIRWFKKYINSAAILETYFLIWFPLNGVMRSPVSRLAATDNLKILHSRKIKPLIDNNIISFSLYGSVEISEKVYDILNDFLKSNSDRTNKQEMELLSATQKTDFSELLLNCAIKTEYDD
jgi:hypothetical protein